VFTVPGYSTPQSV